ncbi:MAG: glycosyltransferase family 39 protein, partial [Pseudomonadota bacterium]
MSHAHKILFAVLFFVAIFLRVWRLDSVPPSVSLDEASIGYNAFSILRTGMDEYKTKWPLVLRAYDDWRPGLYVYLVAASVPLFGLTALAVRFPSVVLSVITMFFTFQTARVLSRRVVKSDAPALWTLSFMAISPWHIYISRLGHEVNLGLALFTAGAYALCHFIVTKQTRGLYWAAVFFSLSMYGYQSEKA